MWAPGQGNKHEQGKSNWRIWTILLIIYEPYTDQRLPLSHQYYAHLNQCNILIIWEIVVYVVVVVIYIDVVVFVVVVAVIYPGSSL